MTDRAAVALCGRPSAGASFAAARGAGQVARWAAFLDLVFGVLRPAWRRAGAVRGCGVPCAHRAAGAAGVLAIEFIAAAGHPGGSSPPM